MRVLLSWLILAILSACDSTTGPLENTNVQAEQSITDIPVTEDNLQDNNPQCQINAQQIQWQTLATQNCQYLSSYGLFSDPQNPTSAANNGIAYELNSALFSDYASKYRFIFLPQGEQMTLAWPTMSFPIGTVLSKTFAMPTDSQLTGFSNERLLETRLLILREDGWHGLTYQWQGQQAQRLQVGARIAIELNHQDQLLRFDYQIPSEIDCITCHQQFRDGQLASHPIGPKPRLLNRAATTSNNLNQLHYWQQQGYLRPYDKTITIEPMAMLGNNVNLELQARGYLDINCGHCHQANGSGSVSGLRLTFATDPHSHQYGICKQPPGWDGGPLGLDFDIVPANADRSIIPYRMQLTDAKDKMPALGRQVEDTEGVQLIKQWINSLDPSLGNCY
ncbi:SO2930 family diheme c-type cytochrome [Paraferrimonas sp. SM1919]|uniref:SO2930 family diheme c-type cytochrome n=1 Tax=Paraferrimonas sp. SM1919 TaxID=2662263 RepID=UPI0013D0085A|nr:SO2930 family diheme c-type cytochrome [Paraferrimonas sp. SM1919]